MGAIACSDSLGKDLHDVNSTKSNSRENRLWGRFKNSSQIGNPQDPGHAEQMACEEKVKFDMDPITFTETERH